MPMTVYDLEALKKMVRDERIKLHCRAKVQGWWIMVRNNGASLSITFEVPNTEPGGIKPSITTRTIAL